MAIVVLIFITLAPNMFHHNNVGVTYVKTSNFKVEPVKSIPLYYVAMLHSMVIVNEVFFLITLAHTNVVMRSKPHTPRGTDLVNMHIKMTKEVDRIFVGQPSYLRGGGSGPPRPSRPPRPVGYFGLPMVNQSKPNMPYH